MKKPLAYVYKCTERETGRFYIGYRYKNIVPALEDFGVFYFTSNAYVKKNFSNFTFEILAEFETKQEAFNYEKMTIKETSSELQINNDKHKIPKKQYSKSTITEYCLFPGCGKYINSSIKRFCCRTHSAQYAASKRHS